LRSWIFLISEKISSKLGLLIILSDFLISVISSFSLKFSQTQEINWGLPNIVPSAMLLKGHCSSSLSKIGGLGS